MQSSRRSEAVALCGRTATMEPLLRQLRAEGMRIDSTCSLAELRHAFFRAGGHDTLILAPDLPIALAARAARALRAIDRELRVIAFGNLPRETLPIGSVRLQAHHPATRAALNAVVRALRHRTN